MLLTLPTELIQLILRSCDPPTYLQTAFCNRTLFAIASKSRDLILHQLHQSPGRNHDFASLTTDELFRQFISRAHQELFGVEYDGDRKLFNFHGQVIDSRASSLESIGTRGRVLLAFKGHGTVYLFNVRDGDLTLERRIKSPASCLGNVQVLHTAFDPHGIYILHRFRPFIDRDLDTDHPFVKHALQSNVHGSIFLAYHEMGPTSNKIRLYAFPDHKDYEPLALAVHEEKFVISWQHLDHSNDHQVVHYTTLDEKREGNGDGDEQEEKDGVGDRDESRETGNPQIITCSYQQSSQRDQDMAYSRY